ncbi:phospholipase [Streptomyces sp. WMMC500]|uniref:PHB depolymerase family esterase n=1 Tax=Streptomyces sp. WMMC500 TaxID=3015154 RepID=UPI00248D2B02|nr:PHB depolymerase family esterase [Streptomyces sp. WMMC500]WBB64081.1 phospholipase [Streptomyces sp. WMMC500]
MTPLSRRSALSLAAGAVATPAIGADVAAAARSSSRGAASGRNPVLGCDLLARVTPRAGWRVTAVALRYAKPVDVRGGIIPPAAFTVAATVAGETAARTVTRVYPNAVAGTDDRARPGRPGHHLIIELDPGDPNAPAVPPGLHTDPYPLDGAYAVRQVADVTDRRDGVVLPASPLAVHNDGVLTPVVDGFTAGSFTDTRGFGVRFRLHLPEGFVRDPGAATRYPLVVTLHGGGEVADNNVTQLTGNRIAVTFAKPERQRRHPAFVLAPQVPLPRPMDGEDGTDWTDDGVRAATVDLLDAFVASHPVDADRIYLVGLSSGGRGIFDLLPRYPARFAAALPTAGWGDPSVMDRITHVPLWADHSVDDPVVPYREGRFGNPGTWTLINAVERAGAGVTRGEWPNDLPKAEFQARSRALLRRARANGSHTLFTSYPAGTTPGNAHLCWAQTYENDVVIDWLFDQRRRPR